MTVRCISNHYILRNRFFISAGLSDNLWDRKGDLRSFSQITQWKNPPLKLCPSSIHSPIEKVRCIIACDLRIKRVMRLSWKSRYLVTLSLLMKEYRWKRSTHSVIIITFLSHRDPSSLFLSLSLICIFYFFACEKVSPVKVSRLPFSLTWSEVLGVPYSLTLLVFFLLTCLDYLW
jgi:hypothetical protein